jgi:predicted dinucleotide-binding enzyme
VGSALERGLRRVEYDVRSAGNDTRAVREVGTWAQIILLAVPYSGVDAAVRELGDTLHDKIVIDVSNPLTTDMQLAIGFRTSSAEELHKRAPRARVVKALNTVFADHMETGHTGQHQLSTFVASDDAEARRQVVKIAADLGFDAVDAGPLKNARWLESLAFLNIQLGLVLGMGRSIGFALVH